MRARLRTAIISGARYLHQKQVNAMMIDRSSAQYEKALAWIVREGRGGKLPRERNHVAGWRVVQLTAALFDKTAKEVASDVVEFAKGIHGEMDEYP
jgi:hypothetical protein